MIHLLPEMLSIAMHVQVACLPVAAASRSRLGACREG